MSSDFEKWNSQEISINQNPRPGEVLPIPDDAAVDLERLARVALKKKFAASLIVNCYNSNICGADISNLSYYCRGESNDSLRKGMLSLISAAAHIESHEIYGHDFVESLIKYWDFRNKGGEE